MENTNEMTIIFDSYSSNEAFARVAVAAFMTSLNPTVEEVADVKTAVSEAVTNAIIHGYESRIEKITLRCKTCGDTLYIEIEDLCIYILVQELYRSDMGIFSVDCILRL